MKSLVPDRPQSSCVLWKEFRTTFMHSGSRTCTVWLRCEPQIRRKRVAQTQQAVEWFDAGLMHLTASEHKESVCGVTSLGAFGIF